jgi:hypothetical protein
MSVSTLDIALATAWRPNVGDTLTGAVAHRETRTTEYGTYPVIYIAVDGGEQLVAVHAFHQTLLEGFKALKPQRGQFVSITYAGEKDSNTRKDSKGEPVSYHHYVVVDPDATVEETEMDWDDPDF